MGLRTELVATLDITSFVSGLGQDVATAQGDLGAIDVPLTPEQRSAVTRFSSSL